jgi:hypothetical protein
MKVTVDADSRSGRAPRALATLPVALGATIVCIVNIGVAATAIVLVATVVGLVVVLRVLSSRSLRRWNSSTGRPDLELGAEATLGGAAGVMRLFPTSLEWTARRGRHDPLVLPISELVEVTVSPVNERPRTPCHL